LREQSQQSDKLEPKEEVDKEKFLLALRRSNQSPESKLEV